MTQTRSIPRGLIRFQTIDGDGTASSQEDLEEQLAVVARDAVITGRGDVKPYLVNEAGKSHRPLKRYVEYLTSDSIYLDDGLAPPQLEQNRALHEVVTRCETLRGLLADLPREHAVIDAAARLVVRREAKRLAAALLRLLSDGEHLAEEIDAL